MHLTDLHTECAGEPDLRLIEGRGVTDVGEIEIALLSPEERHRVGAFVHPEYVVRRGLTLEFNYHTVPDTDAFAGEAVRLTREYRRPRRCQALCAKPTFGLTPTPITARSASRRLSFPGVASLDAVPASRRDPARAHGRQPYGNAACSWRIHATRSNN